MKYSLLLFFDDIYRDGKYNWNTVWKCTQNTVGIQKIYFGKSNVSLLSNLIRIRSMLIHIFRVNWLFVPIFATYIPIKRKKHSIHIFVGSCWDATFALALGIPAFNGTERRMRQLISREDFGEDFASLRRNGWIQQI